MGDNPAPQASALSVINVKNHIPFSLILDPPNYTRWRELFLVLVSKFGAKRHIDGTAQPANDANWESTDYAVVSLFYASISEEIWAIVLTQGASVYTIWKSIEGLFCDNKTARALFLEADFRNLAQGDMPILAYSQLLKSYADALADIDQKVFDKMLVLTLLRGLNNNLRNMATIIKMKSPFPTFLQARSLLLLEETNMKISKPVSSTVLFAAKPTGSSTSAAAFGLSSTPSWRSKGKGKSKGYHNHGGGGFFNYSTAQILSRSSQRSKLAGSYDGGVLCPHGKPHIASGPSPSSCQHCFQQVDLSPQIQLRRFSCSLQSTMGLA